MRHTCMTFHKIICSAVLVLTLLIGVQAVSAKVTAEEAAKLKTTLTPLGAEKAGNAEGTIPAWEGGFTQMPAGYKNGDPRPDFFADEKPRLSISAKNMAQYKDELIDGVKYLMTKYPDFRIDVYPTHRTAAAPQYVYDNTFKNATRAELINDGFAVNGAFGGTPFPIVKNGYEAMLNHVLAWYGLALEHGTKTMVRTPDGNLTMATEGVQHYAYPYYYEDSSLEDFKGVYMFGRILNMAPAYKAGESILVHECCDGSKPRGIWQYLVGQRRVRRAPSVAYDTPDFVTSGIGFFDEAFLQFGPYDHHDYKLVGKKEVFIPYNNNRAAMTPFAEVMNPHFLNPDYIRWELHRVWVVDATLKEGKRHVVVKRRYYIDEDSWQIVLFDGWDAQGEIWRLSYALMVLAPDIPCVTSKIEWGTYNLQTGAYFLNEAANETPPQYKVLPELKERFFSPSQLANRGAR